jgi:hypothetical protein
MHHKLGLQWYWLQTLVHHLHSMSSQSCHLQAAQHQMLKQYRSNLLALQHQF